MKSVFQCLLLLFCSANTSAQSKADVYLFCYFKGSGDGLHYAWSEDGYNWKALFGDSVVLKPTVSKDKLFRDPCIIKGGDGIYHMVWTVSWNDKGIGYASSPDLLHWSPQQFIPVMAGEDSARNTWAPEIIRVKNKYYIYWASTISGKYPSKDTAAESGYNHRIYYSTTKDFRKFSNAKLLYDPGFSVIDASIVPTGDQYVLFLKNETKAPVEKNIRTAVAKKITGPYAKESAPITGAYWAEGPTALKIGNKWIVYFDKYRNHQYGAVKSTDLKNWADVSQKIAMPKGIRHGSVFSITRQEFDRLIASPKERVY